MKKVGIGVIGCGFWGDNHVRVFSELEDAALIAVCDIDKDRAERAAWRHRVPKVYQDDKQLLGNEEIEAVSICTPSTTHGQIALDALRQGKSVLVEKPMTTSLGEATDIVELARKENAVVATGMIERFNPVVQRAKELTKEGEIGAVLLSYARRIGAWPERIGDVGVVKDLAIHDIDLATYLFEETPESVYARGGSLRHGLEDHVQATLSFPKNKSALIEANWLTPRKKREMHVTGEEGVIRLNFLTQELVVEKDEYQQIPTVRWEEPLKLELKHFISCVRNKQKPLVSEVDGYRSTVLAEATLRSMQRGTIVHTSDVIQERNARIP